MKIANIRHKALRRFIEEGDLRGLDAQMLPKLRRMTTYLTDAGSIEEVGAFPLWSIHQLTGDRRGTWSMSVTGNWRLTFSLNSEGEIIELDLEDYH